MVFVDCSNFPPLTLTAKWEIGEDIPVDFTGWTLLDGECTMAQVADGVNVEYIKVCNVLDVIEVTRAQCGTTEHVFPEGACVDCLPGAACLVDEPCECIYRIESESLTITFDEDTCIATIELPENLCDLCPFDICEESGVTASVQSGDEIIISRNCDLFRLPFENLCEALGACLDDGDIPPPAGICAIQSTTLDTSIVDCTVTIDHQDSGIVPGNYSGLAVDSQGHITGIGAPFGTWVTLADLNSIIAGIDVGIETLTVNPPLTTNGDPTNPVIGLATLHPGPFTRMGVSVDIYGRVTSILNYDPISGISTDLCMTPTYNPGTGIWNISHVNDLGGPFNFDIGIGTLSVDQCGHVTGLSQSSQFVGGSIDLASGASSDAAGFTSSLAAPNIVVTFDTAFTGAQYALTFTNQDGSHSTVIATTKNAGGFVIAAAAGSVSFMAVGSVP